MTAAARVSAALATTLLPPAARERVARLRFEDGGHGYDALGFHPPALAAAIGVGRVFHDRYFRVRSYGIENVPARGPAILAANHSGMLPVDATMIVTDVVLRADPPRVPRTVGDVFIPLMPWLGTMFSRLGVVGGSRDTCRYLLERGELLLIFPEGTPGIGKGYAHRYELAPWRVGHVELAIRCRAPVIPVAVVGAEESWPQLARIDRFHAFGAPWLPVPLLPFPLPARFHIHYGEPIALHERYAPADADVPEIADAAAAEVKRAVAALIARGREMRKGVFS